MVTLNNDKLTRWRWIILLGGVGLLMLACKVSVGKPTPAADAGADAIGTAAAQTVTAQAGVAGIAGGQATTTAALAGPQQGATTAAPSGPQQGATTAAPSGQQQKTPVPTNTKPSQSQVQPNPPGLQFHNVSFTPPDKLYYGVCANNEPVELSLQAFIDPPDQVQSATVYYSFIGGAGLGNVHSAAMSLAAVGDHYAVIQANPDAEQLLGANGGQLQFSIEAIDKSGRMASSQQYSVPMEICFQGAGGVVPPPMVMNFLGPVEAQPGDMVLLEWQTEFAVCGVTLDGNPEAENGDTVVMVPANQPGGSTITYSLTALGGIDCTAPEQDTATWQVQIIDPGVVGAPTFGGSAAMYPNGAIDVDAGTLNAPELDVTFSTAQKNGSYYYYLETMNGARIEPHLGAAPTLQDCEAVKNSGTTQIEISQLNYACVFTNEKNISAVTITALYYDLNVGQDVLEFDYSTWMVAP